MIIRLSQKLARRIKTSGLTPMPLAEDPLTDWSAHIFSAGRTRYILACNTRSLYSTIFYARGINDANGLIIHMLHAIRDTMEAGGLSFTYAQHVAPATGIVHFATALDRSVTGSMNEIIAEAKFIGLDSGTLSPFDAGVQANSALRSALADADAQSYGKPDEAIRRLFTSDPPK